MTSQKASGIPETFMAGMQCCYEKSLSHCRSARSEKKEAFVVLFYGCKGCKSQVSLAQTEREIFWEGENFGALNFSTFPLGRREKVRFSHPFKANFFLSFLLSLNGSGPEGKDGPMRGTVYVYFPWKSPYAVFQNAS